MQWAHIVHGLMAMVMIAAILGHIYIGSVGMEGALEAMSTGRVDYNWAKEHHSLWLEEEAAKARQAVAPPVGAGRPGRTDGAAAAADARDRPRRLERGRQDHLADPADPLPARAGDRRFHGEARAPRIRRGPPGKDSWLHRDAGAHQVLVGSARRWALMTELRDAPEPDLASPSRLSPVDLVVVEASSATAPQDRGPPRGQRQAWLHPDDPAIRAVAADVPPPPGRGLPFAALDDVAGVADLALRHAADVEALGQG
jgi:molybdopterin-guanine dinucleotide biosynthesis protein B